MRNVFYVPVLKSKEGEFTALLKLSPQIKSFVTPLFEITPIEWDSETNSTARTLEEHLVKFCKKYKKCWPSNSSFIDTHLIGNNEVNGATCYEFIYHKLADIKPVPVLHLTSQEAVLSGINNLVSTYGISEVAIKVSINDISSMNFSEDLNNLLRKIAFNPWCCHLIFDLKDANFTEQELFAEVILSYLGEFPHFSKWKTFTICGGAFPPTGSFKAGVHHLPRHEWKFYNKLMEKLNDQDFSRQVNYGDYGIVAPGYFEFDPRKMSTSANIRYTHNDIWYVVKGNALKKSSDWQQYIYQAEKIVNSGFYIDEDFCEGDLHLLRCSKEKTKTGNSTVWNWVGNNHHFTKVVNDLFSNQLSS